MIKEKTVGKKNLQPYKRFVTAKDWKKISLLAKNLQGKKIIHINATPLGGGVVEILKSLVPLEQGLNLNAKWYHLEPDKHLFQITKKLHNSLQGQRVSLSKAEKDYYLKINFKIAKAIAKLKPDILIVHDPQPLAIMNYLSGIKAIARIHIDLSTPNKDSQQLLLKSLNNYQEMVFTSKKYAPKKFKTKIFVSPPGIDPLTDKNRNLDIARAKKICSDFGIDINKPVLLQVSRFDPWKDPGGVIDAFRVIKETYSKAQLVLCGVIEAQDDPEAAQIFQSVLEKVGNDKNIILLASPKDLKGYSMDLAVNALRTCADVIFQKSIREGFGLVVTEAMWKQKAVIGGNAEGIRLQITNGKNGFIIKTPKEAAEKALLLLHDKQLQKKMGKLAHQTVQKKFLIPRLLLDELEIMNKLFIRQVTHTSLTPPVLS